MFKNKEIFSIRKFNVGTGSVRIGVATFLVATGVALGGGAVASANETSIVAPEQTVVETELTTTAEAPNISKANVETAVDGKETFLDVEKSTREEAKNTGVVIKDGEHVYPANNEKALEIAKKQAEDTKKVVEEKKVFDNELIKSTEGAAKENVVVKKEGEVVEPLEKAKETHKAQLEGIAKVVDISKKYSADLSKLQEDLKASNITLDIKRTDATKNVEEFTKSTDAEIKRINDFKAEVDKLDKEGKAFVTEASKSSVFVKLVGEKVVVDLEGLAEEYSNRKAKIEEAIKLTTRARNEILAAKSDAEKAGVKVKVEEKLEILEDNLAFLDALTKAEDSTREALIKKAELDKKDAEDKAYNLEVEKKFVEDTIKYNNDKDAAEAFNKEVEDKFVADTAAFNKETELTKAFNKGVEDKFTADTVAWEKEKQNWENVEAKKVQDNKNAIASAKLENEARTKRNADKKTAYEKALADSKTPKIETYEVEVTKTRMVDKEIEETTTVGANVGTPELAVSGDLAIHGKEGQVGKDYYKDFSLVTKKDLGADALSTPISIVGLETIQALQKGKLEGGDEFVVKNVAKTVGGKTIDLKVRVERVNQDSADILSSTRFSDTSTS